MSGSNAAWLRACIQGRIDSLSAREEEESFTDAPASHPIPSPAPIPTSGASNQQLSDAVTTLAQAMTIFLQSSKGPTSSTPPPPVPPPVATSETLGKEISPHFKLVPVPILTKIVAGTFETGHLYYLCSEPHLVDVSKPAPHIPDMAMLNQALDLWWGIRVFLSDLRGMPYSRDSHAGWARFRARLNAMIGRGGPNNLPFSAVRNFALSVLQRGLLSPDSFDFGDGHLEDANRYIWGQTNAMLAASASVSRAKTGSSASSAAATSSTGTCFNWNNNKKCRSTPCIWPHVCSSCGGAHPKADGKNCPAPSTASPPTPSPGPAKG